MVYQDKEDKMRKKTKIKLAVLREFEKQGIKPSKDQIKKAMEVEK